MGVAWGAHFVLLQCLVLPSCLADAESSCNNCPAVEPKLVISRRIRAAREAFGRCCVLPMYSNTHVRERGKGIP